MKLFYLDPSVCFNLYMTFAEKKSFSFRQNYLRLVLFSVFRSMIFEIVYSYYLSIIGKSIENNFDQRNVFWRRYLKLFST